MADDFDVPDVNRVAPQAGFGDDAAKKDPVSPNINSDSAQVVPPVQREQPEEAPPEQPAAPKEDQPPEPNSFDAAFAKYQRGKADTQKPPSFEDALALHQKPKDGFSAEDMVKRFFPDVMPMGPQKAGAEAFTGELTHMNWSDAFAKTMREAGIFNDYAKGQNDISRGVLEGLIMPASHLVEGAVNLFPAAIAGGQGALAEVGTERNAQGQITNTAGLARELAALPEAFPLFGEELGLKTHPHVNEPRSFLNDKKPIDPAVIDKAQADKAIGTTESQFEGTEPLTPEQENHVIDAQNRLGGEVEKPAPDIHEVVRQQNPELFNEYDRLSTERDTFGRWMAETRDKASADARAPMQTEIDDLTERSTDATPRLQKKYAARIEELTSQADEAAREASINDPTVKRVRDAYFATDSKMRDMAPDVAKAYRDAQEQIGGEAVAREEPVAPTTLESEETVAQTEPKSEAIPAESVAEPPVPEPSAEAAQPPTVTETALGQKPQYVAEIANDVTQKLISAGRPEPEARAAAQVISSYYETRAARFEGKRGTAADLYNAEAPEIRRGEPSAKVKELAQGPKGKIRIADDGKKIITLMQGKADTSTFIHETGHHFLEDLLADAEHLLAPEGLKADVQKVRDWLGAEDGETIKTRQHEKFARGFERYMMEGIAPSKTLAKVFSQFKTWLTKIYESVKELKSPISDDIRQVFDRMLAEKPERTVIAPERETPETFADIHESDAATTPPHMAATAADNIRNEIDEIAKAKLPPDVAEKIIAAGEPEPIAGENARNSGGANGPGPDARGNGNVEESGAVPAVRIPPASESPDVGGNAGEASRVGDTASPGGPSSSAPAGSAKQLKELAGNINRAGLNVMQDAWAFIRNLAAENSDFNDVRFGSPAYTLAKQIKASAALLEITAQDAADAFNKWNLSGSETDAEAYSVASQRALLAANARAELAASTGRGLAAFRRVSKRGQAEDIVSFIKRSTGKTLFQLKEEGGFMSGLETTDKKIGFLEDSRSLRWQKIRSGTLSYFINNLISGPITHMAYSVGNTTWALFKAGAITPGAATIDAIHEFINGAPLADRVYYREVPAQIYGLVRGFRDALPAAGRALKTGVPYMKGADEMALREGDEAPSHGARLQSIPGKVGYVLETPSRSVTAIHTIFYSANYTAEIARRAVRSAIRDNLTGDSFNARVADFTVHPPDLDVAEAHHEALKMVLMDKPPFDSFMAKVQRAVNDPSPLGTAAKIVMPFMQIGTNILKGGLVEMTPFGLLSKDVRRNLLGDENGKVDPIARSTQIAKIAVGTSAAIATVGLAMEGLITGGGPADANERRVWMKAGHVPYAMKIGNEWIPYRKFLGPLGPLIAGSADMYEIGHAAGTDGYARAGKALIFGLSEVVFDESWFSGLSNFIGALHDPDREGERYVRNLAMDFLPFSIGLSQVARMIDPYQREVRSTIDALKAHTPFISQQLTPMNDIFGEPIASHSMVTPQNVPPDPVAEEMEKVGFHPALPQRKISGQQLDSQQYADYTRMAGRLAKEGMNASIMTPGYLQYTSPSERLNEYKRIFKDAREDARQIVIMDYMGKPNDISARAAAAADTRERALLPR